MSAVKKKQYLIWKLSLPKIVRQGDGVLLFYDAKAGRPVISLRENNLSLAGERLSHADCIAFQQLRLMLDAEPPKAPVPEAAVLTHEAILFDFKGKYYDDPILLANPDPDAEKNSVSPGDPSRKYPPQRRMVPISVHSLQETLFLYGFDILWNNDSQPVHYIRFASSASMTRNGQQLFVREDREQALSERVTMGLMKNGKLQWEDPKPNFFVSKWSAYKGLALSDGWDMDALAENAGKPLPKLTADSVLIVPDLEINAPNGKDGELPGVSDIPAVTFESPELVAWEEAKAKAKEEENANQEVIIPDPGPLTLRQKEVCSIRKAVSGLTLTDGVGLIDPEFAKKLNALLGGKPDKEKTDEEKRSGSSGQYHSFQIRMPFMKGVVHSVNFKAYLRDKEVYSLRGIDGRVRDLDEIVMILPQSMFKAYKWLMLMKGKEKCVDWYFQQYEAFQHHFFVSQKNRPAEKENKIFLNYQVLHTSGVSWDEMEALVNKSLDGLDKLAKNREDRLDYLRSSFESEEPDSGDEDEVDPDDYLDDDAEEDDTPEEMPDDKENADDQGDGKDDDADESPVSFLQQAILRQPYLAECSAQCRTSITGRRRSWLYRELLHGKIQISGMGGYLCCDLMQFLEYLASKSPDAKENSIPVPQEPIPADSFYAPGYSASGLCALFRNPHYSANEHLLLSPMNAEKTQREAYLGHLTGVIMLPFENMGAMRLGGADFDGDHVNITANDTYVKALKKTLGYSEEKAESWCGSSLPVIIIPELNCGGGTHPDKICDAKVPSILQIKEFETFFRSMDSKIGILSFTAFRKAAYDNPDTALFTALGGCEIDSVKKGYTMAEPKYSLPKSPFLKIIKHKLLKDDPSISKFEKVLTVYFPDKAMKAAQVPAEADCYCNLDYLPVYLYQKQAGKQVSWCQKIGNQKLEYALFFDLSGFSMLPDTKPEDCRKQLMNICRDYRYRSKRLKPGYVEPPVSSYQDKVLIQILFPRCGDSELTDILVNSCQAYSDEMYSGQDGERAEFLERIHDRLKGFELAKKPARPDQLTEALSEVTPKQHLDELVRPEMLNFRNDGFALSYRLLHLAKKQRKRENRFNSCVTEAELSIRFREAVAEVCEGAFCYEVTHTPEELVAAALIRLIRTGSDSTLEKLLWENYGEAAWKLLRKQPLEGGDTQ